jgi:hypothetical protein
MGRWLAEPFEKLTALIRHEQHLRWLSHSQ